MYEEFKKLVRDLRVKKGITQKELARKAGISEMYMHVIESPDKKQLPSEEITRKIAHALADNLEEEVQILKQLLSARAISKIPEEARDIIEKEKIEEYISTDSMPVDFIERLKNDLQGHDIQKISEKTKIGVEQLKAVLQYRGTLSRREVICLADALNQPVYDYLVLANFIPDNIKKLLEHNKIGALFRSLQELEGSDIDMLIDGIINIIEAYKKRTVLHDRRKHKGTGKKVSKEK